MKWQVTTLLREGVKGTEEEVVKNALIQLGYEEITSCKMGQLIILFLQDDISEVEQRKWSPDLWPYVSFIVLKLSRSIKKTPKNAIESPTGLKSNWLNPLFFITKDFIEPTPELDPGLDDAMNAPQFTDVSMASKRASTRQALGSKGYDTRTSLGRTTTETNKKRYGTALTRNA